MPRLDALTPTTKTCLALSACHVVAALVLLYACLALRALLRVGEDPVCRLALVLALLLPRRQFRTRRRLVRLLAAAEAEHAPALALDAPRVGQRRLHHHAAVLAWAETQCLVDVHEARQREALVALQLCLANESLENRLACELWALVLRARGIHTRRPFGHLAERAMHGAFDLATGVMLSQ